MMTTLSESGSAGDFVLLKVEEHFVQGIESTMQPFWNSMNWTICNF